MPTIAQLMKALPENAEPAAREHDAPLAAVDKWSLCPVPVGRLRRIGLLGTLQAKIAAAYLFYWVRGWFRSASDKERMLAETHWRTAARVLDSMSYLRGATMKVGQTLGTFPDIVPAEFVETLEQLHFQAPPMHWSLLREMVFNELGEEPENIFASFEKRAFAAASLGQVHRARLKCGEEVAVKIQYPGIARTISQDVRNLMLFMLPARLSADWENMREQFDDLRMRLEHETDYEREARMLQKVRALCREDDGIVVPRVFPQHSTRRILAMEYLPGVHLGQFLAGKPSQELRNEFARKIIRSWLRMLYAGRVVYADANPGNFIFMADGRLGVIDFGSMVELDEHLWDLFRKIDRAQTTGRRDDRIAAIKQWHMIGDDPADAERLRVTEQLADWIWRWRYVGGEFDFADEADFRRGIDLMIEAARKRYGRGQACMLSVARLNFAMRSILYRLKAKFDVRAIAEEEVVAAGWDRSDYAPIPVDRPG
jgi:aarF domain-containing kinase